MRSALALIAVASMAAACQTAEQRAQTSAALEREIAARQGEEVDRVCFTGNINSWRPLGRDAVLVRQSVRDWYKLDLLGACQPDWALTTIALRTRPSGSSCLTRGDTLITNEPNVRSSCFIDAIHVWNEDAPVAEPTAAAGGPAAGAR
jgi:hypothetical protein